MLLEVTRRLAWQNDIGMAIGLLGILAVCAGCKSNTTSHDHSRTMSPKENTVRITWRNYDGLHRPELAVIIVDGSEVGQGEDGVGKMLSILRRKPEGTTVELYPFYAHMKIEMAHPSGPHRVIPFHENRLLKVICSGHMRLLFGADEKMEDPITEADERPHGTDSRP
jgi:hypothetical protein